jgi:hypothetical protein
MLECGLVFLGNSAAVGHWNRPCWFVKNCINSSCFIFCQFVANSFTLKLPVKKTVLALAAGQIAWYERSTLPTANGDNWLVFGLVHVAASWCVMHVFHVYLVYFSMRIVRQIWDCRPQESFFAACLANGTISGPKQTQLSQTWSASKFPVRSGRNPQRQWWTYHTAVFWLELNAKITHAYM